LSSRGKKRGPEKKQISRKKTPLEKMTKGPFWQSPSGNEREAGYVVDVRDGRGIGRGEGGGEEEEEQQEATHAFSKNFSAVLISPGYWEAADRSRNSGPG
jgi:hypothetical protein